MTNAEERVSAIREELEMVRETLNEQTRRCRQLVTEYTLKLQEKDHQYQSERMLRDDQLTKILRALIIFESRLKREQKYLTYQLKEKDYIIEKQRSEIQQLLSSQYCKQCSRYYSSSPQSMASSSEYVVTDCQSSNFESLDSSSDYAYVSEKSCSTEKSEPSSEDVHLKPELTKNVFVKKKAGDSIGRRGKKFQHRRSIGTYFEVLKMRNSLDGNSRCSNEDDTSNDYENLDSLPSESVITEKGPDSNAEANEAVPKADEAIEIENESRSSSASTVTDTENGSTVINNEPGSRTSDEPMEAIVDNNVDTESCEKRENKLSDSIPVFDSDGDGETNENWYMSVSDHEDEEQRDIYRNNPVLECMNQILLKNISDSTVSPPKTPNVERKSTKNKRVKFSDEDSKPQTNGLYSGSDTSSSHGYYETPVQKMPNFYETPQSIYGNDYEQILNKYGESFGPPKIEEKAEAIEKPSNHFYIDLEPKKPEADVLKDAQQPQRKTKILRTPPALPPKPVNLVIAHRPRISSLEESSGILSESEPDYCSISELNLPTGIAKKPPPSAKKISVVAEINPPNSHDVLSKLEKQSPKLTNSNVNDKLEAKKCVEKLNIQVVKQIKPDTVISPKNSCADIPKLPQVSEIIIPDENEEKQKEERIAQDNYIKNTSQMLKTIPKYEPNRHPIVMGTSVSNLIAGFNNLQLISEIKGQKPSSGKKTFSSFENLQNLDKQPPIVHEEKREPPSFDHFDLSQNFEEFKLDDCEIEEFDVDSIDLLPLETSSAKAVAQLNELSTADSPLSNSKRNSSDASLRHLRLSTSKEDTNHSMKGTEPTYEHFLECTGLSSKAILTPSRLLSNHKNMLKPKDIKLRSRIKSNNLYDRHSTSTIKYWSEPYV